MYLVEVFKIEVKRLFSYRIDFWLQFLVNAATEIALAFYLWRYIYSNSETGTLYGGYTFTSMMLYYLFVPFVNRIVKANDDFSLSREIYDGTFNKYLLYPVSFLKYKLAQKAAFSILSVLQMAIALPAVMLFFNIPLSVSAIIYGLVFCMASFLLYVLMSITLELVAFWAEEVWSLGVMLRFISLFLGGAYIPLSLFPNWAQEFLSWTPFPYLFSYPIRAMTGDLSRPEYLSGILVTLLWCVPVYLIFLLVMSRGRRVYTGVGI
jgi:ABC-2 type transport system permease protein